MVNGVTGIGAGFLSQLFPVAAVPVASGASVIPLRPPSVPAHQVLVATAHDRIDRVLDKFKIPYEKFDRLRLSEPLLAGARYLFIGCGQPLSERTPERIAEWVASGGSLMSTDWMSYHLLEKAFRNERDEPLVRYRQPQRADVRALVSVSEADWKDPTTRVLLREKSSAVWNVSPSSYPVSISNVDRVQVLARSWEMGRLFDGEQSDTLFLRFPYGRGQVVHLVSHWYDQHFEEEPPSDRPPSSRTMIFDKAPHSIK